jgi:ABC-2 type transport system permease protein
MTSLTATTRSTFAPRLPRLRAVVALVRRDFLIRASYRAMLVLDLVIGLLDVVVYYFISQTFQGAATTSLGAAPSYFAFALVGIAITTVVSATSSGIAMRVREEQLTGTLEALVTQPVTTLEMAIGMCGLPFFLATFRVALYLVVGGALGGVDLSATSWPGFIVVLTATGTAMSSIGIVTAAAVVVVKRGYTIAAVLIFGMGLVGGAFFPISVLPGWLQTIGEVVPPRFAFDGLRDALYTGSGWETDAIVLIGFTVITVPLAVLLFSRAMLYGRRSGSLSQY